MAPKEQTDSSSSLRVPLYDYLYRDENRIASYSAQFFGGLLQTLETNESLSEGSDRRTQVGTPLAAIHEEKQSEGNLQGQKKLSLPHDVVTNDVLSRLMGSGFASKNAVSAPHGSLIVVSGTVVFIDKNIAEVATEVFKTMIANSIHPSALGPSDLTPEQLPLIAAMMEKVRFPSVFMLTSEKRQFVGVVKDAGMEEPIPTYYFKHGALGLADVHLIGIKEVANTSVVIPSIGMLSAGQNFAQAMSDMLFPKDAIRVTPIALFRTIKEM